MGTPVIAATLGVYREIAGDIPLYLNPLDPAAWERMVRSFAEGGDERDRQRCLMRDNRAPDGGGQFTAVVARLKELRGSAVSSESRTGEFCN